MRADISRHTFDPSRHDSAVLQQQGRVQLDADWNEQQYIHLHRDRVVTADIVGPTGAPRVNPGFRVTPAPGGANLVISSGHFYINGVLCQNETDELLITEQPDLPGFTLPNADGFYLAYLHAWQRHESAAERPELRESALGGPDTTTRLRTVSQVRLLPLPNTAGNATCQTNFPEWNQLVSQRRPAPSSAGRLQARTAPEGITDDPPCVLPPAAGYKGLENQLYRVEIHTAGDRSTARFKWSRENGSVATPINSVNGLVVTVESTGRDENLSFRAKGWAEISDDSHELHQQRGELFLIDDVNPATREITLQGGPLPNLDATGHRVLRRWEQQSPLATANGQPLDSSDWITLEDGVQVRFGAGQYNVGDYWLVPARSAMTVETGAIEWPIEAGQPAALLSQAPAHQFARLGIVRRQAGNWTALAEAEDCRTIFPPLTAITAADVSFDNNVCDFDAASDTVQDALDELCRTRHCQCTIMVSPGDDVAAAFASIGVGHDALICFRVGHYKIANTITVRNAGHLRLVGCGHGTRFSTNGGECVFRFENCASVHMEHLQVDGGRSNQDGINGAVTCIDCSRTTVEHCKLASRGAGQLQSACLTIRNRFSKVQQTIARVTSCDFEVGYQQIGLLALNIGELTVRDNSMRAGHRPKTEVLLSNRQYRSTMRRNLLVSPSFGQAQSGAKPRNFATIDIANSQLHFLTAVPLTSSANPRQNAWTNALTQAERDNLTPRQAFRRLEQIADQALLGFGDASSAQIVNHAQSVLQEDVPVGLQGIVVGGRQAGVVSIENNVLTGFVQGIHVGHSRRASANAFPDQADRVVINGNRIELIIGSAATRNRHGIFVGNFHSLEIHQNHITANRPRFTSHLSVDAIRVYGWAGPRMSIKDNHCEDFERMIAFTTLRRPGREGSLPFLPVWMWIITDNLGLDADSGVTALYRHAGQETDIRGAILRIDENQPS